MKEALRKAREAETGGENGMSVKLEEARARCVAGIPTYASSAHKP